MNSRFSRPARARRALGVPRAAAARHFSFSKKPLLKCFALALVVNGVATPEVLATNRWFDCASGSVQTATCWSGNIKPGTTDTAFIGYSSFASNVTATLASGNFTPQYEYIGYSGYNGTVNHSGGTNGSPTVTYIISVGEGAGRTGTYNLSGAGVVNAGNTMYVGNYGTGIFNQTGGSVTVPTKLYLAVGAGSSGSYTLQSGTLSVSDPLVYSQEIIGYRGAGSFTQSGGTHTAESVSMAAFAGSTGSYNLSGGNLNPGSLSLSGAGAATFNHSGGTNQVAGNMFLSAYGAGSAAYNLSGSGSLTVGSLFLGGEGTNVFTQTGGTHTVNGNLVMGAGTAASSGTYHLRGGTLSVGISVMQNLMGTGTLNIDGGTLSVGGGNGSIDVDNLVLGSLAGYTGAHTLSGSGTITAGNETIGMSGTGTFTQTGGTHTVTNNLTLGANSGIIGTYNLSAGTLATANANVGVNGRGFFNQSGGTHTVANDLVFGDTNSSYTLSGGTLNVGGNIAGVVSGYVNFFSINGGTLNVTGNSISSGMFYIGRGAGSNGSFSLDNGKSLTTNAHVIGDQGGAGVFTQNGGIHTTVSLGIGNQGGNGSYTLNDGSLSATGSIGIGSSVSTSTTGAFVQNGGSVTTNLLTLGTNYATANVNGTYNLGGGSLAATNENIGQGGGNGTFQQSAGTHSVSGTLRLLSSAATYNLQGGTLDAGTIENVSGGAFNFTGGTLAVDQFTGNLVNNGGTLAPGNSPGTTNITGDYTQAAAGIFAVEIGGLLAGSEYDVLNISGSASLDGTLDVSLIDLGSGLFAPQAGDSFDILTADIISGNFGTLSYAALVDPNLSWQIDYLIDAIGTTDVVRLSVVSAVPVAPAVWLFGSGLLGLMGFAKRKRIQRGKRE